MFNINKIYFLIIAVLAVSIISCKKSDEVITPSPEEVELFSKDSLSVSSSDSGGVGILDTVSYQITDNTINNVKLQYYMETNGGVLGDRIYYGIFLSKPGVSYFSDYGYLFDAKTRDTTLTFNISNFQGMTLFAKVAIESKVNHTYRYVKFKNIKLIKID